MHVLVMSDLHAECQFHLYRLANMIDSLKSWLKPERTILLVICNNFNNAKHNGIVSQYTLYSTIPGCAIPAYSCI